MIKKSLLFASMLFAFNAMTAQYWQIPNPGANANPGGLNADPEYPVGGGIAAGWTTIHTPSATPAWSAALTLPFTFQFNGSVVTQFKVSNSGVLTFDVATALAAPSFTRAATPSANIPDNSICIWGLAGTGTNDNVVSKTFGTAPNRQHWIQFSSYAYNTTPTATDFTYWSIVLDETTNRIHIVDNRTGGSTGINKVSAGLQTNATQAFAIALSPDLVSLAGTDPTSIDNSYYTFVPGVQPAYDLSVTSITTSQYLIAGNNNISGVIKNYGTATITSIDINYKIDGGTVVTSNLTGLSIASGATYSFTHPTPWNATIGTHTIDAHSSNLNGANVDANPSDDHKTKSVNVLSESVQRVPLFEVFTSSTCAPCTPGNLNFHSIVDTKPKAEYVAIKYQQDFPGTGDPYCTTEAVNRRTTTYAINSIPRMELDGGWDQNASSFSEALYTSTKAVPAQFKMNGTYDFTGKAVTGKVKFSPLFNNPVAKLYIAILETKTTDNVKSNGETEFFQVMKKMLPTETGTSLPPTTVGNWDSISFNYTFKGNYRLPNDGAAANRIVHTTENSVENFYNLYAIAWIQDVNKNVYQAVNLTSQTPVGTQDFSATVKSIEVFPNPANQEVSLKVNLVTADKILTTLVDMTGNVVSSQAKQMNAGDNVLKFNTQNLANGIYHLLMFDSKNNSSVHEILVQH